MFLYREVITFIIWFYHPMMDYDVSLHNLVVLVLAISTSPRSSKTESGCKRYRAFSERGKKGVAGLPGQPGRALGRAGGCPPASPRPTPAPGRVPGRAARVGGRPRLAAPAGPRPAARLGSSGGWPASPLPHAGPRPGCQAGVAVPPRRPAPLSTPAWPAWEAGVAQNAPNGLILGAYKRGLLPHWFPTFCASFPPPLLTFWSLLSLSIPP